MPSLAGQMPEIDASIFDAIGETLSVGTNETNGMFYDRHREIELRDGSMSALDISFDCQIADWILALDEGDMVTVEGNEYRFLRRLPDGGDESGLVIIELGTKL